jgi:Ser/Thr protein kinase RdoA (MazF antagonist)
MEQLGAVTARLHRHARAWPRPPGFTRHAWTYETMLGARPIWGRWQDGIGVAGEALRQLGRLARALQRRLHQFGSGPDRYGLIHADLRLANLLVDAGHVKVIDFDDCGGGWYLADYGAAFSFIEDRPDVPDLTAAWLRGYRRVAPLGVEEERELPTFLLLRRLQLVAWLGSHADTDLARALGEGYTVGTCHLAETYLQRFG